jgi:putative solute:sodium symporter small subunit
MIFKEMGPLDVRSPAQLRGYEWLTKRAHTFSPWFLHEQEPGGEECAGRAPRIAAESDELARIGRAMETTMLNHLLQGELPTVFAQAQNSPNVLRTKRLLLTLLGFWMAYFLLVNWFVHSLNKIALPVVGIPLGFFLAAQGAVIVFGIVLFRFARSTE